MKTVMTRFSSLLTAICSSLLSLLGFGCSSSEALMYGMPVGDFEIKGAVTDEAGNDVPDAEIRVTRPEAPSGIYRFGEATTDSKGKYEVKGREFMPEMKVVCIPENKDLQADSIIVIMNYKNPDKHNPWDCGHAEATVDFTLKSSEKK